MEYLHILLLNEIILLYLSNVYVLVEQLDVGITGSNSK